MKHCLITELLSEINQKIQQRGGEPVTRDQFEVLLSGFKAYSKRSDLYKRQAIDKAIMRGWMTEEMAHFFRLYALE